MGDSKTITVPTENGDVIVRKLALADYAVLLRALNELPGKLGGFLEDNDKESLQDNATLFSQLLPIIADSIPEVTKILAVVTDKDAQFFADGDLSDAVEVFAAALELNNYQKIVSTIKKLLPPKAGAALKQATEKASPAPSK